MNDEQRPSEVWPALFISERLAAKDAEISRLKAQVKELSEAYQKAIGPIQPADHRRLITELCDALEGVGVYDAIENMRLIQRAREATRYE